MLVLTRNEVEELLDLDALPDALAVAHAELSGGQASLVPRMGAFAGETGILGAMPAYAATSGLGCKLVTLFPENRDRPTHQAAIALFDPATGAFGQMPANGPPMFTPGQIKAIADWVDAGCPK